MKTSTGNRLVIASLCVWCIACSKKGGDSPITTPEIPTGDAEITISATDTRQTIQGFGAASAFAPPNTSALTSAEFDRLFGSANGQVGLNILRIRVATDEAWRTTELNYSKAAMQRGARIIATPWSPPAAMKTNNNLVGGSLKPDSSLAYANYLNNFASYMEANGVPLYAISVQNEPDIAVNYESCDWTAPQMTEFIKLFGDRITKTRLMAPESFNNNQAFTNTLLSDDVAAANLDLIGAHIYGSGITENALAKQKNKEVWMTEHLDTNTTYTANLHTAVEIHECLTRANFNAYIWWYAKRFYGPIGQDGAVTKRGFIMSQFARFIKPGATRIETGTNSNPNVLVSAYNSTNGKKIIVAINRTLVNVRQKFTVGNATLGSFLPYATTQTENAKENPAISSAANSFTYTLLPMSITTFVEQ